MALPQIKTAIKKWQQPINLVKITQVVDNDGFVSDDEQVISFQGVVQPLKAQQLILKPEELRSWEWLQIHTLTLLELETNDGIIYKNKKYKVNAKLAYNSYGFFEYHLVEAFSDA